MIESVLINNMDVKSRFRWKCRTFTVFNAEHIDGIGEYKASENRFEVSTVAMELILNYCEATDLKLTEGEESGGRCYYSPDEDVIRVPSRTDFYNEYSFLSSVLHECCHSTLHEKRMNRTDALESGSIDTYAKEELRAEIGSSFLCADIGLDISEENMDNHAAYIKSWISELKEKPKNLFYAIDAAEKIAEYIEKEGKFEEIINQLDSEAEEEIEEI